MRYTLICPCGAFFHNLHVFETAALQARHEAAEIYPSQIYDEVIAEVVAEAVWVVT